VCGCEPNFVCTRCEGQPQHDFRVLLDPPKTRDEEVDMQVNQQHSQERWEPGTVIRK
jgi:hypothetical protein